MLRGGVLARLEQDDDHVRLVVETASRRVPLSISLAPARPWIGCEPAGPRGPRRRRNRRGPAVPFGRTLEGSVIASVTKPAAERRTEIGLEDGRRLVLELRPSHANLLLVDPDGSVRAAVRRRRAAEATAVFRPAPLPPGRLDPFGVEASVLRAHLYGAPSETSSFEERVAKRLFGVGPQAARLVMVEAEREAKDPLECLVARLAQVQRGELDPSIETLEDAERAAEEGRLEPTNHRLLPWEPVWGPPAGFERIRLADPASTAGLYHALSDRAHAERARRAALVGLLGRAVRRVGELEGRVREDLAAFEDPERFRVWGEALLAGLNSAKRVEGRVLVPDPYAEYERTLAVPVEPGQSLTAAAAQHFKNHRRARRGIERARERLAALGQRRERLQALADRFETSQGSGEALELEQALQAEGIAVGLDRQTTGGPPRPARVEGVRVFVTQEGDRVLLGKTARDNDRLTFRLAGPEDFWLHAQGVPGAHVVITNDKRHARPSEATLREAAAAAAWFSAARHQPLADVLWTRRKLVRRLRGAAAGLVRVKRFETVRVRPVCPSALVI